jgi:hypothetical protein
MNSDDAPKFRRRRELQTLHHLAKVGSLPGRVWKAP